MKFDPYARHKNKVHSYYILKFDCTAIRVWCDGLPGKCTKCIGFSGNDYEKVVVEPYFQLRPRPKGSYPHVFQLCYFFIILRWTL